MFGCILFMGGHASGDNLRCLHSHRRGSNEGQCRLHHILGSQLRSRSVLGLGSRSQLGLELGLGFLC